MAEYKAKRGGSSGRGSSGPGGRKEAVRVKSARGRKLSSTRWLQRQLNDPFVAAARDQGYRGRAAFKLSGLDDRFKLLKPGMRIVDLGAAPGGWCQIAVQRCKAASNPKTRIVGIDLQEIEPIPYCILIQGDVTDPQAMDQVRQALGGQADMVMSDMAAASTGHHQTDHLRIIDLIETALDFADQVLVDGGSFVAKILQGGAQAQVQQRLKRSFKSVKLTKPDASRSDSTEVFLVAKGYRGRAKDSAEALPSDQSPQENI